MRAYKKEAPAYAEALRNIPGLGYVQNSWTVARVGELGLPNRPVVKTGPFGAQLQAHDFTDAGIPVLNIGNVQPGFLDLSSIDYVSEEKAGELCAYRLSEGDLVFSRSASIGRTACCTAKNEGWLMSYHLMRLSVDQTLCSPEFVMYSLMFSPAIVRQVAAITQGGTRSGINTSILENLKICFPRLEEQKKIVDVLQSVDEAIEATRAVIDQTRQLKTALLQDLLTNGMPGTGKRIQPEARPLSSVVGYWQYGLSESLSEKGNYPCLRMNNYERGRIVANPLKYIDLPQVEFERYRLNQNDILFNRTNSRDLVGKVGIFQLEGDFVFASYLVRLTPDTTQIVPEFLNILLNTELYQQRIRDLATPGVSQCNINVENLKKLCIPVPKLREQQEVVRVVESIENRLLAESSVLDRLIASKAALSQGLLTGRITVNGVQ